MGGGPSGLAVSGAGAYKAAYDVDGNMITQQLPGGIAQQLGYDDQGRVSTLEYDGQVTDQDTGVVSSGSWLAFGRSYDQSGMVAQDLAAVLNGGQGTRGYSYDAAGRLVTVTDAQTGGVGGAPATCTVRQYAFDSHGNRAKLTATTNDTCTTDGTATGATQAVTSYAYDAYSRQINGANGSGTYSYDAFGRQTTLPAVDAADPTAGDVTIGYYGTDAARSTLQGGVTTTYALDPDGRRVTSTVTGGSNEDTTTQHYADGSDSPAWATTGSGASASTTAYTAALGAGLGAQVTTGSGAGVSLDLANISGDIAATVTLPATGNATGIDSYTSYDEYGNPQNAVPATGANQYGWNGTDQRATGGAGLTLMGARLYNPGTGRFTSTDPIVGGNENAYTYPNNPINFSDLNGLKKKRHVNWGQILDETLSVVVGLIVGIVVTGLCASTPYMCWLWVGSGAVLYMATNAVVLAIRHRRSPRAALRHALRHSSLFDWVNAIIGALPIKL